MKETRTLALAAVRPKRDSVKAVSNLARQVKHAWHHGTASTLAVLDFNRCSNSPGSVVDALPGFVLSTCRRKVTSPMLKIKEFIELWLMGQQIKKAFAEAAKAQPQKVEFAPCGYCGAEDPYRQSLECHHCGGN